MLKKISVLHEDSELQVSASTDQDYAAVSLTEYEINGRKSTSDNTVYEVSSVTEIYLDERELEEMINSLQSILTFMKSHEE